MDKNYQPKDVEEPIYKMWESGGYFKPTDNPEAKTFSILLPPPNANADLHAGHAMYVIEDIMIRYHRMLGDASLWLAGADHAGFETQFVYEKHLAKKGMSRFDFDRETLYKDIWNFVQQNRGKMENQLRRLGFSLDWSRNIFTLDPKIIATVYTSFKRLFDEGLVYRANRLVNYCTHCGTSFSDLEVKHEEIIDKLYYIKYPLEEGSGSIIVATTRPETMFGDEAVAVHPTDKRYKQLVNKNVLIPLSNRSIPIITDSVVKKNFGTGAVKITPAHDENDFKIGNRHSLHVTQVIGFNGKMMRIYKVPNQYYDISVIKAREAIITELSRPGVDLLDHIDENHKMVKGVCYKCDRTIEPLPLSQWFIKIRPLADEAIDAIKKKKITFIPKRFEKTALLWLTNFHDWNISRQNVWGIRIPAWRCLDCIQTNLTNPTNITNDTNENWIVTDGETPQTCVTCGGTNLEQDTDTFDTWFSSGQWPFATLQATNNPDDFKRFYPTSVMETGYDILPWWICRMLMLGTYLTNDVPFKTVYLHGLVRDAKGQKMSKSKGNVINPLLMVDTYGADALRMALVFGTGAGNDQALAEDKIRSMRNFANKLWNIGRFIEMSFQPSVVSNQIIPFYDDVIHKNLTDKNDKRIITELNMLTSKVTKQMETYRFSDAAQSIYDFAWHRVADVHLEKNKERFKNGDVQALSVLHHVFLTILKLLHPFMPFITEHLWNELPQKTKTPLIISPWPAVLRKK